MMKVILACFLLLLPLVSEAAYKIYLKNGSAITGVKSYEKQDGEVLIHFGGGSIGVPESDILKIQEVEMPEKDFRSKETPETRSDQMEGRGSVITESPGSRGDTSLLRAELDSITAELKALDEDEARVRASIEEKRSKRFISNSYQLRRIGVELEPLEQELSSLQQKKGELSQRRAQLEGELRRAESE